MVIAYLLYEQVYVLVKLLPQVSQVYGVSSLGILLCLFTLYSLVSAAHMVDQQYDLAQC